MSMTKLMLGALLFGLVVPAVYGDDATKELPKIVLVGDSIRLSYASVVAEELKGVAVVVSPSGNGGDSNSVRKVLQQWVIREQPDIVHFNCGIHDTKKFTATGKFQVSPEAYAENLKAIVQAIRKDTKATVCFATSTPILDERAITSRAGRDYQLLEGSIQQYNAIAVKVMKELNVPVDDLHAAVVGAKPPHAAETLLGADGVHFTASGKELLGKQVAQFLKEQLAASASGEN